MRIHIIDNPATAPVISPFVGILDSDLSGGGPRDGGAEAFHIVYVALYVEFKQSQGFGSRSRGAEIVEQELARKHYALRCAACVATIQQVPKVPTMTRCRLFFRLFFQKKIFFDEGRIKLRALRRKQENNNIEARCRMREQIGQLVCVYNENYAL
jgi:hypothetical protein